MAALPIIVFDTVSADGDLPTVSLAALLALAAWSLGSAACTLTAHDRMLTPVVLTLVDSLMVAALLVSSKDVYEGIRPLLPVLILAPVLALPPGATLRLCVGAVIGFALVSIPQLDDGRHGVTLVLRTLFAFIWVAYVAFVVSRAREENRQRLRVASEGRRRLLADVLDLEARERREVATQLHEGPLQLLLAARQDLEEAREERDPELLQLAHDGLVDAVASLRKTIAQVHPVALDHGGLRAALRAVADEAGVEAGFSSVVNVTPEAVGVADAVVVDIVRTALATTIGARETEINVLVDGSALLVQVRDDGSLMPDAWGISEAPRVTLAATTERVAALGGALEVTTGATHGKSILARLPIA